MCCWQLFMTGGEPGEVKETGFLQGRYDTYSSPVPSAEALNQENLCSRGGSGHLSWEYSKHDTLKRPLSQNG